MNPKFEYKFVPMEYKSTWTGALKEDYKAVIEDYGRKGWRLVQVLSPEIATQFGFQTNVLIFERLDR
jgi:hypothetical protein